MGSTKKVQETTNEVREATVDDASKIYGLVRELAHVVGDAPPSEETFRYRLGELLEDPRARVLVAEGNGGIVGAASLWIKPDLAHGDATIEVPMLVVSEDHRREGVGKLLVAEVRNVAAHSEATLVELVATRANVAAQAFYRSLGFVEADVVSLEFVGSQNDHQNPEK